jgi:hypothetical protein
VIRGFPGENHGACGDALHFEEATLLIWPVMHRKDRKRGIEYAIREGKIDCGRPQYGRCTARPLPDHGQ